MSECARLSAALRTEERTLSKLCVCVLHICKQQLTLRVYIHFLCIPDSVSAFFSLFSSTTAIGERSKESAQGTKVAVEIEFQINVTQVVFQPQLFSTHRVRHCQEGKASHLHVWEVVCAVLS